MWIIIVPYNTVDIKLNYFVFIKHLAQILEYWSVVYIFV